MFLGTVILIIVVTMGKNTIFYTLIDPYRVNYFFFTKDLVSLSWSYGSS